MATTSTRAALLQQQRAISRTEAFKRATKNFDDGTRSMRGCAPGRDEDGRYVFVRRLRACGVFVDKWYADMTLRREDRAALPNDWREAEVQLKRDPVPRKTLRTQLHIIRAVRMLKHIRQGYGAEVAAIEKPLALLDELNILLAGPGRRSDKELDTAIATLRLFDEAGLANKQVAIKRVVARGRLDYAIRRLKHAREMPLGGARDMEVSRACALFSAFRARLGEWREREIEGIAVYNFKKECALRMERDRWLLGRLSAFAETLEKIYEYDLFDDHRRRALLEINSLLSHKAPKEFILMQMRAVKDLFRVSSRARVDVPEAGVQAEGTNTDFLIGHYGTLYRYIAAGHREKAFSKIGFIASFVNGNKPPFIFSELSKDADRYLKPVLEKLETAVAAYRLVRFAKDVGAAFADSKFAFAAARDELKKLMSPKDSL